MTKLRHILFPYDFSKQGRQVVPFVKALATQSSARLTLFSVVPPTFDAMPSDMDPALRRGDDTREWIRRLQERLDQALVDELAGLCVQRIAECGDPALRITHFAETHDVDLIMMPTHGLGTFRNLLVGSVTSKVLHDSKCPVWTAAHAETQKAPELPRKLLCALDGSVATAGLAKWAADFSAHLGASLNFVHVVESVSDMPWLASEQRLQDKLRADARDKILLALNVAGVEAPLRIAVGSIVQTVTEDARQESADMVIVGRGLVGEPFGRLRTHALAIIQRAPCPVLSV